jgi:hypothetical protein
VAIHPGDLVGYLYAADLYCAACLTDRLAKEGRINPGGPLADRDRIETLLDQLARTERIDRTRENTFDSGDFPKGVLLQDVQTLDDEQETREEDSGLIADRCCGCAVLLEEELAIR